MYIKKTNHERKIQQVGIDGFTFKEIKKDYDGWVDAKKYLPHAYDLVHMKMENKTIPGWWNGTSWEGYRMRGGEEVLFWKYKEERGRGENE